MYRWYAWSAAATSILMALKIIELSWDVAEAAVAFRVISSLVLQYTWLFLQKTSLVYN